MSDDVAPAHPYSPRQPLAPQTNGMSKTKRANTIESQGQYEGENHAPYSPNQAYELNRVGTGDAGISGNESDGIKEYYKAHEKNSASKSRGRKKGTKKNPPGWVEAEKDESNWIHRDKLKEIETKELEEFSMRMGRASRSNSRSQSAARNQSRGRANSELTDPTTNGDDRNEYPRMISPIPAEDEEEDSQHTGWDIRSPAEIEAEREQYAARNNHVVRPSTSRIPVAKTSPLPVPHNFVDRDQPLPRPRNGSGNWDSIAASGARVRSGSVSSQLLLDEPNAFGEFGKSPVQSNFSTPTSPVTGQTPKAKTPGKTTPASRKTSGQKSQSKPRNASAGPRTSSGSSPVKRPGTSGGAVSRPTTSHRPEGEAPWLATMYKPDPRLPPDQQIIPTHAKRMQQEQWETEGRVGSMYDKDFRLLNTDEFPDKRASQIQPIDLEKAQADQTWPLPSPDKPTVEPIDTTVRSPTNEQGKFKLTPTIPQSPSFPRAPSRTQERPGKTAPPIAPVTPKDSIRLPEPPSEPEKEKKGCCCIVM
ncbi:40S ribosomal protein S12 [Kalmusia sp. IMI 367209]|nr:40S ribosomal protein S12 [Kalmusia sp. IMI 367209]